MARYQLQAQVRTVVGKQVGQMRRAGRLPGVVYGPLMDSTVQVSVDAREFQRFYHAHGHATLFDLNWDGGTRPVFIRDVQQDPVRRNALHVDFYAPNMRATTTASVPVVLENPNPHHAGVLTTQLTEVAVEGTPDAIPSQIVADISGLVNTGDTLRVADLVLPEGVTATIDLDAVVAILDDTSNDRAALGVEAGESVVEAAEEAAAGDSAESAAAE